MSNAINREGTFRARITDYLLHKAESGSQSIGITVAIDEIWHEGEWWDWREHDVEAFGWLCVVKKNRELHLRTVESLCHHAGWDGSFTSIAEKNWDPRPVQVVIKQNVYQGETRYSIAWVNSYDSTPSGGGNLTDDEVKELETTYGAQMRALAGSAKHAEAPAPEAKPKRRGAKPKPPAAEAVEEPEDDDVPF